MKDEPAVDVRILEDIGAGAGLYIVQPQTDRGRAWLEAHVQVDPLWGRAVGGIVVEGQARAAVIADALREAGLVVE